MKKSATATGYASLPLIIENCSVYEPIERIESDNAYRVQFAAHVWRGTHVWLQTMSCPKTSHAFGSSEAIGSPAIGIPVQFTKLAISDTLGLPGAIVAPELSRMETENSFSLPAVMLDVMCSTTVIEVFGYTAETDTGGREQV